MQYAQHYYKYTQIQTQNKLSEQTRDVWSLTPCKLSSVEFEGLRITIHSRRESGDVVILTTFELHEGYRDALIAIGSEFLGAKLCIIANCGRLGRLDCMEKHTLFILILLYLFLSWGLVSMYPAHYITCSPYYITKNCNNYSAAQALCDCHGALYY